MFLISDFQHIVYTFIGGQRAQQADFVQMFGCRDGERQHVPDGLVEAGVGPASEAHGQVLVLQVVLHVAHLVVDGEQLLHGHCGTLLDPSERWRQHISG